MATASDYIQRREIKAIAKSTAEWDMVEAQVRERAFFMAGVENARILQDFKDAARDVAAGKLTANEARKRLRGALHAAGYEPAEDERGGIHDLSSRRRMEVTLRTNVDMARGWMQREQMKKDKSQPGLRLFRAQDAEQPRDWSRRWAEAAQAVDWQGVARGGEMVALIDSPIWVELSRFGNPYPPFDFGSKMRVKAVPYAECARLGLVDAPQPTEQEPEEYDPEYEPRKVEKSSEDQRLPETKEEQQKKLFREYEEGRKEWQRYTAPPTATEQTEKERHNFERVRTALQSFNENTSIDLRRYSRELQKILIKATQGIARVEDGKLVMIDKNGTRPYTWQEIGEIITMPGPDGVPNLQAEVARQAINDNSQLNKSKANDPRRPVLIALRDRIIPTVSDGSDPKMTIHRALSFSDEKKFNTVLQSLLAVDGNNESWYRPLPGFLVDSWNNNQATIQRYANKRYSIILHMNKYHSRRRIDGLYKHIQTDKEPPLGIESEGESWMAGDIPLRLVNRNPKVTTTEDGQVTYEFWVEEP